VLDSGARYDPKSDRWAPLQLQNAPTPRYGHTASWTGTEMIICGGHDYSENGSFFYPTNFGRYFPVRDLWVTETYPDSALQRSGHSAIWTGSEMIVWGGQYQTEFKSDGLTYQPAKDSWRLINPDNRPPPSADHKAVWSGDAMIIWGGKQFGQSPLNNGGRYNPAPNAWSAPTSTVGAAPARRGHRALWTGAEMIVWGGVGAQSGTALRSGGRYNPTTDSWSQMNSNGAPAFVTTLGNQSAPPSAIWTGTDMLVWGVTQSTPKAISFGARYDPITDLWLLITSTDAPEARAGQTAVWTGTGMLVYGGILGNQVFDPRIYYYVRSKPFYLYKRL